MTNQEAKERYKKYRPGVHGSKIKEAFFAELTGQRSVFEFGCNNGWNLEVITKVYPGIGVLGIDVNRKEVMVGRRKGRNYIKVGDDSHLPLFKDNSFDVVFTSSVICHIPDASAIIEHLKRIAKNKVVLIETLEPHGQYYFAHDYEAHGFTIKRSMVSKPGNGCLYHHYEFEKPSE